MYAELFVVFFFLMISVFFLGRRNRFASRDLAFSQTITMAFLCRPRVCWRRLVSALSINALPYEAVAVTKNSAPASLLSSLTSSSSSSSSTSPSSAYLAGLLKSHLGSLVVSQTNEAHAAKNEILELVRTKNFALLIKLLLKVTSSGADLRVVFSNEDLLGILSSLVKYQLSLLSGSGSSKLIGATSNISHAHHVRDRIRNIYGNLIYGAPGKHLYSRDQRNHFKLVHKLTARDYENLIELELGNGKLDLASKWFQRLETIFPEGQHYSKMTPRMWTLKWQVYGGGAPQFWVVEPNAVNSRGSNPRRSKLKYEKSGLLILEEYVKNASLGLGNAATLLSMDQLEALLYSVSYSGNTAQTKRLVESNWGITESGNAVPGFTCQPARTPTLSILHAIVVGMLKNHDFVAALTYLNAFQEIYNIDLGKKSANFWDSLFRWSELSTRFTESRSLQHFIKEANGDFRALDLSELTLAEAQKLADFDYEGYLKYASDLLNQRVRLVGELWKCYCQCSPRFSVKVYKTYLDVAAESKSDEMTFELLAQLALQHQLHLVPRDSYNLMMASARVQKIGLLYMQAMQTVLARFGMAGHSEGLAAVLDEWALDAAMKQELSEWLRTQQVAFEAADHNRRAEALARDDDDKFLGLMG